MTHHVPACDMCNIPRCGFCHLEKFKVGWKGQKQALYTWRKDAALRKGAALCKGAALFGLTTAEPDLHQPPDLRDVTTNITCTTLEPDPTYNQARFQDGPPSAAIAEHVTTQSLIEHSLHRESDALSSPTTKPRLDFGLSSLSLNHVDTIGIAPDPSPLTFCVPKHRPDWTSPPPHETDAIDRIIVAFNGWRAEGSNASDGSSPPTNAVPPKNSQSDQSTSPKQSRKRTSDQGHPSKQGRGKRAKTSTDEVPKANEHNKRVFACPFWKKDPIKHKKCFMAVLTRIRDVKQHLRRKHMQPVFCPRCGMEFGKRGLTALGKHLRAAKLCGNGTFLEPEGVTPLQDEALGRYSDRSADEAEQWYVIWGYLFPGGPDGMPPLPRPTSPYVDEDLSEDILAFHEFSQREGWGVVANDPEVSHVAFEAGEVLFQTCLDRIYQSFLARRSHSSQQSWEQSPITLSDSSTPDESVPTSDTTSIDHPVLDDNIMTLSDFSTDLDFDNNLLGLEIDSPFGDYMAMPSADHTIAQTFPSVPLLTSVHEIEHTTQEATMDPALISR